MLRASLRLARPSGTSLPALGLRFLAQKSTPKPQNSNKDSILSDKLLSKAGLDSDDLEDIKKTKKWSETAKEQGEGFEDGKSNTKRNLILAGLGLAGASAWLARPLTEDEKRTHPNITKANWELDGAFDRIKARYFSTVDAFAAPVFDKVLPDPLAPPYDRPTLVIAVDDLLVKSSWTRKHGWRVAKRPGTDYFLGYLAQYYEIVLFSDKYQSMGAETVYKLDPLRASVSYALFREHTRYHKGDLIKDLRYLNRDLKKVILLDVDPKAAQLQPDNCLILPKWNGKHDKDLVRLIPLLEWIGAHPIKDVRKVVHNYNQSPDGVINEFERRDKLMREQWEAKRSTKSLSSLLGIGSDKMPQDYIREEAQKNYLRFQKHVEEYGKKLVEEEEQRVKEELSKKKVTLSSWISGNAEDKNPEDSQKS